MICRSQLASLFILEMNFSLLPCQSHESPHPGTRQTVLSSASLAIDANVRDSGFLMDLRSDHQSHSDSRDAPKSTNIMSRPSRQDERRAQVTGMANNHCTYNGYIVRRSCYVEPLIKPSSLTACAGPTTGLAVDVRTGLELDATQDGLAYCETRNNYSSS